MAFGQTLDGEDSKAIHEALKDPTVTSIRFIDTGERAFDHTQAECFRADGTSYVLTRRHKRFRDAFEIVDEMDLPYEFHDTFFVDLTMPRTWRVEWSVQVDASANVTAYTEEEARAAAPNVADSAITFAWDFADFRITGVTTDAEVPA